MVFQKQPVQIPEQFAGISKLGSVLGVYRVTGTHRWISAIVGIILIMGAALAVIYAVYDTSVQVARYGPIMVGDTVFVPAVSAILLFFSGALATINAFVNWKKSVIVYDDGLGYSDNHGVQIWYWANVEWFYVAVTKHYHLGIHTGTTHQYTLQKTDGSKITLDNKFEKIEALGRLISHKITPYQYNKLLQKIRSGQTARLGKVTICKDSLSINKKIYTWDEIETVNISNGYARIKKRGGGWLSGTGTPVSTIPNFDALFAIVAQIIKINKDGSQLV